MTKSRKLIGVMLLVCFALTALIAISVFDVGSYRARAAEPADGVESYFYNQLTAEQKELYQAMEEMYTSERFIRGEDYDLVVSGHVTQKQLEAYANGSSAIINALGAARDAFYTDHDDIFYVDFGYISLRVTQDGSGYHAWLGSGRADTYWTKGFTSESDIRAAIEEYNTALAKAVAASKAAKPTAQQIKVLGSELADQVAQIREAHRQVAKSTVYRLETQAGDDAGHVRTPYGVFVKGKSLCEGYARAFKAIMDELGVPCVLVNGAYRHGNNQEEVHMWTYVQLDGQWYAVDPTFDDLNFDDEEKFPGLIGRQSPIDNIEGSLTDKQEDDGYYAQEIGLYYNEDYFLKGAAFMNTQHATSPYKSEAEYAFTYPQLCEQNFGGVVSYAHGGLFKVVQAPHDGAMDSTDIYVSVLIDGEWCGYAEAEAKGYYILVRYEGNYLPEKIRNHQDLSHLRDDEYLIENGTNKSNSQAQLVWAYLNPVREPYDLYPDIKEGKGYTVMRDTAKPTGIEFALTTREPREYDWDGRFNYTADEAAEMTIFAGDLTMFEARSGFIPIKYGNPDYQPAPHIVRSTPTQSCKLLLSSFREPDVYNITIEYDQILQFMKDPVTGVRATTLQMSVYGVRATGEVLKGTHAIKLAECVDLSSVKCDPGEELEDGTFRCGSISFKFTPYKEWAYDNVAYVFNFNLEGVHSGKQVNPATYAVGYECEALCYLAFGYHWNVFAQPRLMEEDDLSKTGWVTSDGTDVSQSKDRLALVVTKPSEKQDQEMMDKIDKKFDENILESFTYNITLTICKSIVINTGMGVRVCVGFPEGFTYSDAMNGVSFKAYHFTRDKWDVITGVEEIECTVTPLGLVLLCKSFSPFAIVAAESDQKVDPNPDKSVMISATTPGGTAYTDEQLEIKDKDGKTTTTTAKAYMFSLKAGGERTVKIEANSGYVIESIKINGVESGADYGRNKQLTVKYEDLAEFSTIEVQFVAERVQEIAQQRGETTVERIIKKAVINLNKEQVSAKAGKQLKIEAAVTVYGDANSYQWYKDGVAIEGQTGATLLIEKATARDSGSYTLQVHSATGSQTVTAVSRAVTVTVTGGSSDTATNLTLIFSLVGGVLIVALLIVMFATLKKNKA